MNKQILISSAIAGLIAASSSVSAHDASLVAQADKEKCYGVAKKGQNDCSNLAGTHSCGGYAKTDNDPGEWKYVAKGSCKTMGGMSADEAKAKSAKK
jgi:uncharacterized membrane protein